MQQLIHLAVNYLHAALLSTQHVVYLFRAGTMQQLVHYAVNHLRI